MNIDTLKFYEMCAGVFVAKVTWENITKKTMKYSPKI